MELVVGYNKYGRYHTMEPANCKGNSHCRRCRLEPKHKQSLEIISIVKLTSRYGLTTKIPYHHHHAPTLQITVTAQQGLLKSARYHTIHSIQHVATPLTVLD